MNDFTRTQVALHRADIDYAQMESDFNIFGEVPAAKVFREVSALARDVLKEAKQAPPSPRATALVAFLASVVEADAAAIAKFEGAGDRIVAATDALRVAHEGKRIADAAFLAGTSDPKEALRLHSATVVAAALVNLREREGELAALLPPIPVSKLPPRVVSESTGPTRELAGFAMTYGVVLDNDAPRPAVDSVAIALRQAKEADDGEALFWVLAESRELAAVKDPGQRAQLEKLFDVRARAYAERARFGEFARS